MEKINTDKIEEKLNLLIAYTVAKHEFEDERRNFDYMLQDAIEHDEDVDNDTSLAEAHEIVLEKYWAVDKLVNNLRENINDT